MAADPESYSLLEKVVAAGVAILTPFVGVWKYFDYRLDKKMDKSEFKDFMDRFDEHAAHDKTVQGKLFDQLRENEQRAQDRHERLLERLSK